MVPRLSVVGNHPLQKPRRWPFVTLLELFQPRLATLDRRETDWL